MVACKHARFVIYYKSGETKYEDRADPYAWDHAQKHEYVCQECGKAYPDLANVDFTFCLQCWDKAGKEATLIRQSAIIAMGIAFDPIVLQDEGHPIRNAEGEVMRMPFPPFVLKGSSVIDYNWIQFKPSEREIIGHAKVPMTQSLTVGRVENAHGWVTCYCAYLAKGVPCVYSYRTTLRSLGIDKPALKLAGIKLEECGKRIVTKRRNEEGKPTQEIIFTDLGERHFAGEGIFGEV